MSESPEAIRKYIAPSPRAVIVRRTKVLMPRRSLHAPGAGGADGRAGEPARPDDGTASGASCDPEQPVDERLVVEVGGRAAVDHAALVEDDDLAREPAHDGEVL